KHPQSAGRRLRKHTLRPVLIQAGQCVRLSKQAAQEGEPAPLLRAQRLLKPSQIGGVRAKIYANHGAAQPQVREEITRVAHVSDEVVHQQTKRVVRGEDVNPSKYPSRDVKARGEMATLPRYQGRLSAAEAHPVQERSSAKCQQLGWRHVVLDLARGREALLDPLAVARHHTNVYRLTTPQRTDVMANRRQ